MTKMVIGNIELCALPDLGIGDLQVRIDTGAKTSSLHVDNIERIKIGKKPGVKFDIHPEIHNVDRIVTCRALICDVRRIKSSNGKSEQRYVINTPITMGGNTWPIEITLTDRSDMSYLMLLGREAMGNRVLVDPSQTFVLSDDSNDQASS